MEDSLLDSECDGRSDSMASQMLEHTEISSHTITTCNNTQVNGEHEHSYKKIQGSSCEDQFNSCPEKRVDITHERYKPTSQADYEPSLENAKIPKPNTSIAQNDAKNLAKLNGNRRPSTVPFGSVGARLAARATARASHQNSNERSNTCATTTPTGRVKRPSPARSATSTATPTTNSRGAPSVKMRNGTSTPKLPTASTATPVTSTPINKITTSAKPRSGITVKTKDNSKNVNTSTTIRHATSNFSSKHRPHVPESGVVRKQPNECDLAKHVAGSVKEIGHLREKIEQWGRMHKEKDSPLEVEPFEELFTEEMKKNVVNSIMAIVKCIDDVWEGKISNEYAIERDQNEKDVNDINDLRSQIDQLEIEARESKERERGYLDTMEQWQREKSEHESELKSQLNTEIEDLRNKVIEKDNEIRENGTIIESLQDVIKNLEGELAKDQRTLDAMRSEIAELHRRSELRSQEEAKNIASLTESLNTFTQENSRLRMLNGEVTKQYNEHILISEDLRGKLDAARKICEEQEGEIRELMKMEAVVEEKLRRKLKMGLEKGETPGTGNGDLVEIMRRELHEKEQTIGRERMMHTERIEDLERQISRLKVEMELMAKNEQSALDLAFGESRDQQSIIRDLQDDIIRLKHENSALMNSINTVQRDAEHSLSMS